MKRLAILASVVGLIGLTAAIGRAAAPGHTAALRAVTPYTATSYGNPEPPQLPCIFPNDAELAELAGASGLVLAGTVEGQVQKVTYAGTNQPFTRYALRVRSVLRGPAVSGVLTLEEAGGVVQPIFDPGPQVVFLDKVQHTDGLTSYYVVDGLRGTFLTRANGMTRECVHGVARASDFVTDGESETAFGDRVRQLTPPARVHK